MRILLVEDDYHQSDAITRKLAERFSGLVVEKIKTELEFRERISRIISNLPDIILMDIMMRWTDPSPDVELAPEEIRAEGFFRAGLRCVKLLKSDPRADKLPIILYTILEGSDIELEQSKLPTNVHHIRKESDPSPLIAKIFEITRQPPEQL